MTWSADPAKNRAFELGEVAKIRWEVLPWTQGVGLDIGCGGRKLWPSSIGIDSAPAAGVNLAGDATELSPIASESMDYVFSSHCLEDLDDTVAVLREWWRVLKVGAHLVLYLPHADLYPNRGTIGANPHHKHDFRPEDLVRRMEEAAPDWAMREDQTRGRPGDSFPDEYSFLQVYTKRPAGKGQIKVLEETRPGKRCIVVRYGGIGDALVGASTFPHLKAEGWHITVYASLLGARVLRFDPHVDRIVIHDIVGESEARLHQLYRYLETRCERFVNFSQTFENLLLADARRQNFYWPHAMRHRYMNGNYLEAAHEAAGVPQDYRQKFHATDAERIWAAEWWRLAGEGKRVVIAASGSGVNKQWPGLPAYVEGLVGRHEDLQVVVLGELRGAKLIEHPRVHVVGERIAVRRTLAIVVQADLVIGQETGVLNAAAFERMPKIVLLSHSSAENLTKHWVQTYALSGDVACHPCHRLHSDWKGCRQDPQTRLAACQSAIGADLVSTYTEGLLWP